MSSLIQGYEYDIFISYRQNDNLDGWVTELVKSLEKELKGAIKDPVSIYYDENPQDGLLETHNVDKSLERKLKCLIFIPIVSQTYCDPNCFAWQHELTPFVDLASQDALGMNVQLANGNVASRILPIKIHDIDTADEELLQERTGSIVRSIDFIYQGKGVNRPLSINESQDDNTRNLNYKNQINKVANAIKELVEGASAVKHAVDTLVEEILDNEVTKPNDSFGQKVKQRDLLKVGLVYTIFSLVLWKAIDLAVVFFSWSSVIVDIAAIGLIALLPVALLFAWLFERGPSGFIMTSSLEAKNNPFTGKQKKPLTSNTAILALLVVMLVLYFVPQTILPNIPTSRANLLKNKSIAVLYFDNMSGDPEQEYFSDGITEEIIARLTKIEGLRVISRTSTRVYKGKPINLKQIAKDLNVSAVLEGSFRKVGNKIKVTAQLIDAETDEHIWAETFDRELQDVFAVQADIAHQIAAKFEVDITPETDLKISEIPTKNLEAYEYFLRGKHIALTQYYWIDDTTGAFERAKKMYDKAIQIDAKFAEPYAGLGDLYDEKRNKSIRDTNLDFTVKEDSLRHALSEKAIKLAPNSSWVNNTRAWIFLNKEEGKRDLDKRDLDSGFYYLKRACELDPNDPHNVMSLAGFYRIYAHLDGKSIELFTRAIELNPMDPNIYSRLASIKFSVGDYDDWNVNREIQNNLRGKDHSKVGYYLHTKNYTKSEHIFDSVAATGEDVNAARAFILASKGKKEEARAIIKEDSIQWLDLYLIAGMKKEAIEELKKYPIWVRGHYYSLANHPNWDPYRQDADFQELLNAAKIKYDSNMAKYGPYMDEFLKKRK